MIFIVHYYTQSSAAVDRLVEITDIPIVFNMKNAHAKGAEPVLSSIQALTKTPDVRLPTFCKTHCVRLTSRIPNSYSDNPYT